MFECTAININVNLISKSLIERNKCMISFVNIEEPSYILNIVPVLTSYFIQNIFIHLYFAWYFKIIL